MKKFLLFCTLMALVSGCASYYHERPMWTSDSTDISYEPAGAARDFDPNPNWDVNARDINERPYRAYVRPWTMGAAGSAVYTSTDTEKNIGPQIQSDTVLP